MLCFALKSFSHTQVLNDHEFKQSSENKSSYIAKPAISNAENFIKAVNSENNITKYFTIKDLNSTFNNIGNPFSLFHFNINLLSFNFDDLQRLMTFGKLENQKMENYKL